MKIKFKTNVIAATLLVSNIGFSADVADFNKLDVPATAESSIDTQNTPTSAKPANTDTNQTTPATAPPAAEANTTSPQTQTIANPNEKISLDKIDCNYSIKQSEKVLDDTVKMWSEKAALQTFNYSSENIDAKLLELKKCFTEQGWVGYTEALTKSGNVLAIKSQNLSVSSQIDGSISVSSIESDKWQARIPIQVVYQNDKEKLTQSLDIDMLISRKSNGDLGVLQIIAAPRDKKANINSTKESS
jgi:hypothetical protein